MTPNEVLMLLLDGINTNLRFAWWGWWFVLLMLIINIFNFVEVLMGSCNNHRNKGEYWDGL